MSVQDPEIRMRLEEIDEGISLLREAATLYPFAGICMSILSALTAIESYMNAMMGLNSKLDPGDCLAVRDKAEHILGITGSQIRKYGIRKEAQKADEFAKQAAQDRIEDFHASIVRLSHIHQRLESKQQAAC